MAIKRLLDKPARILAPVLVPIVDYIGRILSLPLVLWNIIIEYFLPQGMEQAFFIVMGGYVMQDQRKSRDEMDMSQVSWYLPTLRHFRYPETLY